MAKDLYRIKNWKQIENSESRKCERMRWVAISNSFDNRDFRRLVKHEKGLEIYGVWVLLMLIAGKVPKAIRDGSLVDEKGETLTVADFVLITGFSEEYFTFAIPILLEIGLLEKLQEQGGGGS